MTGISHTARLGGGGGGGGERETSERGGGGIGYELQLQPGQTLSIGHSPPPTISSPTAAPSAATRYSPGELSSHQVRLAREQEVGRKTEGSMGQGRGGVGGEGGGRVGGRLAWCANALH